MLGRPIVWVLGCTAVFAAGAILWLASKAHPDSTPWIALAVVLSLIVAVLAWPRAGER